MSSEFILIHRLIRLTAVFSILACSSAMAYQDGNSQQLSPQQAEIKQITEQFVAAFNKGDAKAIAARWAENGEMNIDGNTISGKSAIEADFAKFFKENPGQQISVHIESIKLIGPSAAIEKGISEIMNDDDNSVVDAYTLVYARHDNAWQIVKSDVQQVQVDPFGWKEELGMLVGNWKSGDGDWRVETKFEWAQGGNFLKRTFEVFEGDKSQDAGVQVIGWDARVGTVRSWMFHAGGGNGDGIWIRDGNQWVIECESITADGEVATSTNILTILGDDDLRWQSTNRTLNGVAIDDTDSIRVKRVK